jgi:hypothetical protein
MRRPRARSSRVAGSLLVALVAWAGLGLGIGSPDAGPPAVRAAAPGLTLVAATTYEVRPVEGRVAVTAAITATNNLRDTVTRRFFFDDGYLAVLPGTSNFAITAAIGKPTVVVSSRSDAGIILHLGLGSRLAAGKSLALTLTYDLVDPGGAPDRPLRISPSLVSFQVWASATNATPGSSVEVRIPTGYTIAVGRGPLTGPTTDVAGWQILSSGPLETPLTFVADLIADRPGDYVEHRRSTTVGDRTVFVDFRTWPDDPAWLARASDVVTRGLPALSAAIGTPWPSESPLTVAEVIVRSTGGYEGIFDPSVQLVQVGYQARPGVILHEVAHGWFNGGLVADRWIAEAFASYYAEKAATALGLVIESPDLADVPEGAAFPLNAWRAAGDASAGEDAYGIAASLALAREIAAVVGDDALREVWRAATASEPAYQAPAGSDAPIGATEAGATPPDWRALLDLLEAGAEPSQVAALEDLWRRWVVRPDDAVLLDARAAARSVYDGAVEAAAPWSLPRQVRDAMRTWRFAAALQLIGDARAVLRQRAAIESLAAAAGLTPPDGLRVAFESSIGLPSADAEAQTELAALGAIDAAERTRIADPDLIDRLGLIGADPETRLATARSAFEAGDLDAALREAASARTAWQAVPGVARGRIISAGLLAIAFVLLAWLVTQRRRRRSVARAQQARPDDRSPR